MALTKEQNDRLTRVGPGTPMGELFRRYWLPVAATVEMEEEPVKQVRLLGDHTVAARASVRASGMRLPGHHLDHGGHIVALVCRQSAASPQTVCTP